MKITCQSCQSKYTVSDEKVQGKTVKIKCRKCGATILVNSGGVTTSGGGVADPVSLSTGGAAADAGGASYLVNVSDGDQRSMTLVEIVAAYQSSVVNAETYVWADGMSDWSPLGQVDSIVSALNGPAPGARRRRRRLPPSPPRRPPSPSTAWPPAAIRGGARRIRSLPGTRSPRPPTRTAPRPRPAPPRRGRPDRAKRTRCSSR